MGKDSYWFKHDSSAGRGSRMRKMTAIHGHEGKGLYWDVLETLREQSDYVYDSDDLSLHLLSEMIGCKDVVKFHNWFKDCVRIGLFEDENGRFCSPILCENMKKWETAKSNGSKGGRPKKTQTKPEAKPKRNQRHNLNHNLNETIREEKRRIENRKEVILIAEQKPGQFGRNHRGDIFFIESLKLEAQVYHDGIRYGNQSQRNSGGLSEDAIKQHCNKLGVPYESNA